MKRRTVLLVLAAALLVTTVPLAASTFVAMTPQQLIDESEAVIQGRVVAVQSFWNEAGNAIVTEATIQISEAVIGQAPSTVNVRVPGGQVGDLLIEAIGFPTFEMEQEVILFVGASTQGHRPIIGHQQGHFQVVERLDGVVLAVPQVDEGARFFTPSGRLMAEPQSVELNTFKAGLRGLAERSDRVRR